MKRLMLLLTAGMLCGLVQAGTERTWVGGSVGAYETATNWQPEGVPANHDTLVFNPGAGSSVLVTFAANASSSWDGIQFKSGKTVLGFPSGVNKANIAFYDPATITVSEGASAVISNRVCAVATGLRLTITGGGDLTFYSDQVDNVGFFNYVDIEADTSVTYVGGGGQPGVGPGWQVRKTYIRDGATLFLKGNVLKRGGYGYNQWPSFDVATNGALDFYYASGTIGGISGTGTVRSSGGTATLTAVHDQGSTVFGGTTTGTILVTYAEQAGVSADDLRVTLASENAFANVEAVNRDAIRFSSDCATYRIKILRGTHGADGLVLEDETGAPIALHAQIADAASFSISGCGDFYPTTSMAVTGAVIRSTGVLGLTEAGTTCVFGDGVSAANDADVSTLREIRVDGATARFQQVGTDPVATPITGTVTKLELKNNTELTQVDVTGPIYLYDGVKITRPKMNGNLKVNGNSQIEGDGQGGLGVVYFDQSGKTLELVGGSLWREAQAKNNDTLSVLPLLYGAYMGDTVGGNVFRLCDGSFRYMFMSEMDAPRIEVKGGVFSMQSALKAGHGATAASPNGILLDGGTVELKDDNSSSTKRFTPFPDDEAVRLEVGAAGGCFKSETFHYYDYSEYFFRFQRPLVPAVGVAKDGGVSVCGAGSWEFMKPLTITGGFAMLDGKLKVNVADLATTSAWYGTGDFIAGNTYVDLSAVPAGQTLALASGAESELVIKGAPFFLYGTTAAQMATAKHVTARTIRAEKGGVLALGDYTLVGLFDGSGSTFKVTDGVPLNADTGLPKFPAVAYPLNGNRTLHLTYDATKGFVAFTNYVQDAAWDVTTSTYATVPFLTTSGKQKIIPKNATAKIGGLKMNIAYVQINAGAKLEVGNGTDAAVVIFDNESSLTCQGEGDARGTLDFRGSLGVFAGQTCVSASAPNGNKISCRIAGTGGVAFASSGVPANRFFCLTGENVYSGGTYVNSCRVTAQAANCFGVGDVYVGTGERTGGRIKFAVPETYANAFHVGGRGMWDTVYNTANGGGALYFESGATLAGTVELVEDTEICVTNGVTATIAGCVSGKRLVVFNGLGLCGKSDCSGTLALAGANAYAGGTEIVRSTVSLTGSGTLGTGDVLLDGGTLAFNKTADSTVPNRITGKGTIKLEGKGVVTFTGGLVCSDFGGLVSDNFTLALGNRSYFTVPTLDGFSAITTDRAAPIDLYVLDGKAFAGTVPANVTVHDGPRPKPGAVLIIR